MPPRLLIAAIVLGLAATSPARSECVRIGDTITCTGVTRGSVITPDSVIVDVVPGSNITNIPIDQELGLCPLSPPVIAVGNRSTVNNAGSLLGFGTCASGIQVGDDSTVTNTGRIETQLNVAAGIVVSHRATVINAGEILVRGAVSNGVFGGDEINVVTLPGSLIQTFGSAASGLYFGKNITVNNGGTIRTHATDASAVDIVDDIFAVSPTYGHVTNTGLLEAVGDRAVTVRVLSDSIMFDNAGQIRATFLSTTRLTDNGRAVGLSGERITIVNTGEIAGMLSGMQANASQSLSFTNSGTIASGVWPFSISQGRAVDLSAPTLTVMNHGMISGQLSGLRLSANQALSFTNTGTIMGGSAADITAAALEIQTPTQMTTLFANTGRILAQPGGLAVKAGNGNNQLNHSGEIAGGIEFGAGEDLFVLQGGRFTGHLNGGAGIDRVVLAGSGDISWTASNVEDLLMLTPERWTVAQDVSFTNLIGLLQGDLRIEAERTVAAPNIVVLDGAGVSGTGTLRGQLLSGGRLSPGASNIGTLGIDGNLVLEDTSIFAADIGTNGINDRVNVSGDVDLSGTLQITPSGRMRGNARYDLITAGGVISGTFARIDGVASAFVKADTVLVNNGRTLSLTLSRLPYASVGQTPSQFSVAGALDGALASGSPALLTLYDQLDALDAAGARQAYDQLSTSLPIAVAVSSDVAARTALSSLRPRLRPSDGPRYATWGRIDRRTGHPGRPDRNGYGFDLTSATVGLESAFADIIRAGAAITTITGDLDLKASQSAADLDYLFVSAYASTTAPGVRFAAAASWGDGDADTLRRSTAPIAVTTMGATDQSLLAGWIEASLPVAVKAYTLEPGFGVYLVRQRSAAYTETGPYSLAVARDIHTSLRPELKFSAAATAGRARPYTALAISYELQRCCDSRHAAFAAEPGFLFALFGLAPKRTWVTAEIGLEIALSDNLTAHVGFDGNLTDATMGRKAFAGVSLRW